MKLGWDRAKGPTENARTVLPVLASRYFGDGRRLLATDAPAEELHQFRLATKRFRYTLEFFRGLYGPSLDKRLSAVRQIQNHLGSMNDCTTTRDLLAKSFPRKGRRQFAAFLAAQEKDHADAFRRYWIESFDAPGQEKKWLDYLIHFAGRRRRRR